MKSAQSLYNIYANGGQFTPAILVDLFGLLNWPQECREDSLFQKRVQLFDGLYKGLYMMDVPVREIEAARKENRLDALIHQKYKGRSSGYYEEFCREKIMIGRTQIV